MKTSREKILKRIESHLAELKTKRVIALSTNRPGTAASSAPKPVVTTNGTKTPMKAPITHKSQLSKQGQKNVTPPKGSIASNAVKLAMRNHKK